MRTSPMLAAGLQSAAAEQKIAIARWGASSPIGIISENALCTSSDLARTSLIRSIVLCGKLSSVF